MRMCRTNTMFAAQAKTAPSHCAAAMPCMPATSAHFSANLMMDIAAAISIFAIIAMIALALRLISLIVPVFAAIVLIAELFIQIRPVRLPASCEEFKQIA